MSELEDGQFEAGIMTDIGVAQQIDQMLQEDLSKAPVSFLLILHSAVEHALAKRNIVRRVAQKVHRK